MFAAAENAARRACDVSPYNSFFGKAAVALYTRSARAWHSFQAAKRSYGTTPHDRL